MILELVGLNFSWDCMVAQADKVGEEHVKTQTVNENGQTM